MLLLRPRRCQSAIGLIISDLSIRGGGSLHGFDTAVVSPELTSAAGVGIFPFIDGGMCETPGADFLYDGQQVDAF